MKATYLFLAVLLAGTHGVHAASTTTETVTVTTEAQEDTLYAQGNKAMDEQRWTDAVDSFDKVAAAKGKKADAALYWKAYSLNKLNRKEEAAATCGQLRGRYADSTWNRECRILQARTYVVRASPGGGAYHIGPDDTQIRVNLDATRAQLDAELGSLNLGLGDLRAWTIENDGLKRKDATEDDIKLLALNSLMQRDPAKGVPLMRDLVKSNKPIELRKQALFALARSKQPEAQQAITEIATGKGGDPELQREAVQLFLLSRGKEAAGTLVEIYRNTNDPKIKRAALSGLYSARDAQRLVELARSEKDLNMKRDIVAQLALMKDQVATDYMMELLK